MALLPQAPQHSYQKYGSFNTHDLLKCIALAGMVIDHAGKYFFPELLWMRAIGRIAFPLFLFLVGYSARFSIKADIVVLAFFMAVFNVCFGHSLFPFNVLVTIILTRMVMGWLERKNYLAHHPIQILFAVLIWCLPSYMAFEFGTLAIGFALIGYQTRHHAPLYLRATLMISVLIPFVLLESHFLAFGWQENSIFAMVVLMSIWLFYSYRLQTVSSAREWNAVLLPIQFIARNSLWFYVLHLTAFQIIAYFLMRP